MPPSTPPAMVKFFRVKEKARDLARQQKFDEALAEYRAAIGRAEKERDQVALRNLYNAAGDASLQKNDSARAVEYFEKAVDSYLEEGLHDNSIALCHKILRHVPTKVEVYARLGRIYGEKGLRNEAIQNWLEYAERREKAGDLAGVTLALREVLGLSPDSDVVRQQLVEVLLVQGEARGALQQLEELRRRAELADDAERVSELDERISAVRAEAAAQPPAPEPAAEPAPEEPPLGGEPPSFGTVPAGELGMERFEPLPDLGAAGGVPASVPPAAERIAGLDAGFGFSVEGPGLQPPSAAPGVEPAAARATDARGDLPAKRATPETEAERAPVWTLPGFTAPDASSAGPQTAATAPIAPIAQEPPLEIGRVPFVPVEERIARAEARLGENPTDAEERVYLSELYQEAGALDLARAAAEQAAAELLQAGEPEAAYRAYRRVVTLAPAEIEAVQKLVDVAQGTGRRDALIESYEMLGNRLMSMGQYEQAREVHRRILDLEPSHGSSQDQLLILEGLGGSIGQAAAAGPASDAHGSDAGRADAVEYVDLASLIQEGEADRATDPRMRSATQPTGDEQADLQAIIEAFRRGVEENIDERDFESHYDLGVAFRDMGLLDEAVREFQLAARGRDRRERAFELMGLCFMEKGMPGVAVNCFRRGIESGTDPHEALGLHYHLARSLEELGDPAAARDEYAKVVALDVQFLDAAERLQRLG